MNNWVKVLKRATLLVLLTNSAVLAGDITVIKAGSLFDSSSGRVTRNAVIVVEDDKIIAVGGADTKIPEGAELIEGETNAVIEYHRQ